MSIIKKFKGKEKPRNLLTFLVPVCRRHIRHGLKELRLVWRTRHVAEGDADVPDACRTPHQKHLHHPKGLRES